MARRSTLTRTLELAAAAQQVIALRTARMLASGASPTASDRREMSRMVSEKIGAFGESWWAMASRQQLAVLEASMTLARAYWSAWLFPWSHSTLPNAHRCMQRQMQRAQVAAFASGLAPLHRVATANARRLSRRAR